MKIKRKLGMAGKVFAALLSVQFVALIGVACWGIYISLYSSIAASLPDEIQAAKKERLPLTPAALSPATFVDDDQNAALIYSKIQYEKEPDGAVNKMLLDVINDNATNADLQAAKRTIAANNPQLYLAEKATLLPECDFHHYWSLGPDYTIPESWPIRRSALLLAVKAEMQSDAGHPEAALRSIEIVARMKQHLGKQPDMNALLQQIALEKTLDVTLLRVIKKYAHRPDILTIAAKTEQSFGDKPDLKYSLDGEVVTCRMICQDIRMPKGMISSCVRVLPFGLSEATFADASEARSISFWRRVFAALKRVSVDPDPMASYRVLRSVEDAQEILEANKGGTQNVFSELRGFSFSNLNPTYEWSSMLCPRWSNVALRLVQMEARRRLRLTLLTILKYRLENGHFPETLSMLSPPSQDDPFISKPMHYQLTAKGCILYSVGENLMDDGGNAIPKTKGDQPPDIVVTFP